MRLGFLSELAWLAFASIGRGALCQTNDQRRHGISRLSMLQRVDKLSTEPGNGVANEYSQ